MTKLRRVVSLAMPALLASTCTFFAWSPSVATAAPCLGSGSLGSSSNNDINPIPWLNGSDGRLPELRGHTQAVAHITGPRSTNDTIFRFSVLGTDLGIMWDNGAGQVLTAFGDTVGLSDNPLCGLVGDWRSNILLRSSDRDLTNGMSIENSPVDRPNHSKEIIQSKKIPGVEQTVIPTTGISVGPVQYINYMSVRSWGAPGEWETNASGIAYSVDNGENWVTDPLTLRPNVPGTGAENFQMGSYVKHDGFVYAFGTPSGRSGDARLSRVPEAEIRNLTAYEYWDGKAWVKANAALAAPVIPGPVSELSVQFNEYLGQFVAMYTDAGNSVVMRRSDRLESGWSAPEVLVSSRDVPELYGAYMHPWSKGSDLYFLATTWSDYNVMLLRTNLAD
ncbi:carbohydrate-binding domain protein [Rhodococcus oxybenzonivorans]|uniref:Carbohydrate-binding domain protein n=1 Tax=Rhodococcus oxybenzonivorans TaxID=1990687 RepID=A0A2S2BTE9_9NOCA|nr:DUF4185 domain-containing protein [Rhodococcus oxybenzonivorans]AWK71891.1 carbohydrate-binding domain protein [Rhodococcus oxybenzonivorans]